MSGKFTYRNQPKRFSLYSFYAKLNKTKIVELLDKDGNTPYDSDAMRNSVWEYAASLYKDITDIGHTLSYHDSDNIGPDSVPQKNEDTFVEYNNLKKSLYSLSDLNSIDNAENTITSGFQRKYYTVPTSDSDGTIRHTNILLFLKSHLDRWLTYDSFERFKLTSRIMDNLDVDSDLRSRYTDNFLKSVEEDSDLARRVVELYSNVMQTDSEVRNEVLHTAITALSGLTPGGDSDAARALTEVISGVYETDSDVRNEFGDHILLSLQNDSDQQTELGDILSSTEIPLIQAIDLYARAILPKPPEPSTFVPGTTSIIRGETSNAQGKQSFYVDVSHALGGNPDTTPISTPPYYGGAGVKIAYMELAGDFNSPSTEYLDITIEGDSDGAGNIQNNAYDLQNVIYTGHQDDVFRRAILNYNDGTPTYENFNFTNYLIVDSTGAIGGLPGNVYLKINTYVGVGVDTFPFTSDPLGSQTRFKLKIIFDSDSIVSSSATGPAPTGTIGDTNTRWSYGNFSTTRTDDLILNNIQASQVVTVSSDSESRLVGSNNLKFTSDSDNPLLYNGLRHIAIDSDTFYRLLIDNQSAYTLDSDSVAGVISETPVKSEIGWPIGQVGDVYVIDRKIPDSEVLTVFDSDNLSDYFAPSHGTLLNWATNGTYGPTITMWSNPGSNDFREANTTKAGGFVGHWEIEYSMGGYGFHGFSMFPTSAAAEASNEWLYTQPGGTYSHVQNINIPNYVHFTTFFVFGHQATSGLASVYASVSGTGGAYAQPQVNGTNPIAQWYGAPYPLFFRIGRDREDRVYVRIRGGGYSGTENDLSPKYYVDATTKNLSTSTYNAVTISGGIQFGWGNYDMGPAEVIANISLTNTTYSSNYVNSIETKKLMFTSDKVTNTAPELARALGDTVTKQQVFNTWYRISHQYTGGGTPGTFTYPANASEQNSWAFDAANDVIYTTANTTTFCGFISSDTYDDFTFNSKVNAPYAAVGSNNDDDSIISIVGFVTEGIYGQAGYREHTLSLVRTHGGFPMISQGGPNVTWCLVYNYNQDDNRLLVNKSSSAPIATSPWANSPHGSKLFIRRKGDSIVAYCSQMNDSTHTLDSDTEIAWDLASDSDTLKFRGPVKYGYGAHSQNGSYWSDIFFKPDVGQYLHHVPAGTLGSVGGSIYAYDPDTTSWVQDSDLTVDNTVGHRFLHNTSTKKTFYNNSIDDKIYDVMTAGKFTDVMRLPPLATAPASPVVGMFAVADKTNWDPTSSSGSIPYIVYYDGSIWKALNLA